MKPDRGSNRVTIKSQYPDSQLNHLMAIRSDGAEPQIQVSHVSGGAFLQHDAPEANSLPLKLSQPFLIEPKLRFCILIEIRITQIDGTISLGASFTWVPREDTFAQYGV